MSKVITIKLMSAGQNLGPFNIYDDLGNTLDTNVSKKDLISGRSYLVDDAVQNITIESIGRCKGSITKSINDIPLSEFINSEFVQTYKACLWRHLTDPVHYNFYYGFIEPYVIEYPFSYQYQDEILQNVQDYTKVYEYTRDPNGVFNDYLKVQPNNKWFNKAVLYNDQQSSGLLELESKPLNNLQAYNAYPKYNAESKTITFTKSDNFYQYNTFWNVAKDPLTFLFKGTCASMSIDKVINQDNMDYSTRVFKKAPLRAKDLKIRHILDNSSTTHLVSQFIVAPAQNSYK